MITGMVNAFPLLKELRDEEEDEDDDRDKDFLSQYDFLGFVSLIVT